MRSTKLAILALVTFPALGVAAVLGAAFGVLITGYAMIIAAANWGRS